MASPNEAIVRAAAAHNAITLRMTTLQGFDRDASAAASVVPPRPRNDADDARQFFIETSARLARTNGA
jgi:hypothetical protein